MQFEKNPKRLSEFDIKLSLKSFCKFKDYLFFFIIVLILKMHQENYNTLNTKDERLPNELNGNDSVWSYTSCDENNHCLIK